MRRPSTVILLLLLSTAACLAQSGTNYISRRTYFRPDVSYQDVTYYDGLGYTAAEVQVGAYSFESMAYDNGRIEGSSNTVRQYVTDHLGNVRAVVTNGNVVERNDYCPFDGVKEICFDSNNGPDPLWEPGFIVFEKWEFVKIDNRHSKRVESRNRI